MSDVFEQLRDMGNEAPRLHLITTGAGAGLQRKIWDIPGVSNFFAGASMPYATEETVELLGFTPDKFVSKEMAVDLAMAAYMKAWVPGRRALGLGMTCSVASTREHRGDHRVIAAVFGDDECYVASMVIPKGVGAAQRVKDGDISDYVAEELIGRYVRGMTWWNTGAHCLDIELTEEDELARQRLFARPLFWADGTRAAADALDPRQVIIFSGAFNPPHPGHFGAAEVAQQARARNERRCRKLVYATTTTHPIKPALTTAECLQRARMMKGRTFLVTEGDGRYITKAQRFPGAVFAMGADALDRMLDPMWGPVKPMLNEFAQLGTRFMVSRRKQGDQILDCERVIDKQGLRGWPGIWDLFTPVDFQLDLSSTELREKAAK